MEREEHLSRRDWEMERRGERGHEHDMQPRNALLGIVGAAAFLGIAALVVINLPDIKRYIKISSM